MPEWQQKEFNKDDYTPEQMEAFYAMVDKLVNNPNTPKFTLELIPTAKHGKVLWGNLYKQEGETK